MKLNQAQIIMLKRIAATGYPCAGRSWRTKQALQDRGLIVRSEFDLAMWQLTSAGRAALSLAEKGEAKP